MTDKEIIQKLQGWVGTMDLTEKKLDDWYLDIRMGDPVICEGCAANISRDGHTRGCPVLRVSMGLEPKATGPVDPEPVE